MARLLYTHFTCTIPKWPKVEDFLLHSMQSKLSHSSGPVRFFSLFDVSSVSLPWQLADVHRRI